MEKNLMQKTYRLTLSILFLSSMLFLSSKLLAVEGKEPVTTADVASSVSGATSKALIIQDPVAIVNGRLISKAALEQYIQQLHGRTKMDSAEANNALVEQMVLEELLVQEAEKQKLYDDSQIKQQLALVQRSLLASSVIKKMLSENTPGEDSIRKEYETAIAAMKGKEYRARHILLDSEDRAKGIITELKKGGNFSELAKLNSSDGSKENGGDLGWFTPNMMVPPFAQAISKMEKGSFSEQPVQTSFGWHVLLLEDIRDAVLPSLEELRPQIEQILQSQRVNEYLEKLKSVAKITISEIRDGTIDVVPETANKQENK
jgi:peptidyl-prolyl cis-trans isomerase C